MSNDKTNETPLELQVSADQGVAQGVYSNLARVTFTKNEFVIGFVLNIGNEAHLVSRVILSPDHMEHLNEAIQSSLNDYNEHYGS